MEIYVKDSPFSDSYRKLNGMAVTHEVKIGMELVDFDTGKVLCVRSGSFVPDQKTGGNLHISDYDVKEPARVE